MGRKPIGEKAMSAAERQRKRRQALRDRAPVTKQECAECERLRAELSALRDRTSVAPHREPPLQRPSTTDRLKADVARLRRERDEAREALKAAADGREVLRLRERVRDQAAELRANKAEFKKRHNFVMDREKLNERERAIRAFDGSAFNLIARVCHPDTGAHAAAEERNKAMAALNELRKAFDR